MSDVARLLEWFDDGLLMRPGSEAPGTVHLARALAALSGAPLQLGAPEKQLASAVGEAGHYVFVLADGLGMNLVEPLPHDAFLKRHLAMELRSVFPSSTAPSLTSIATGLWPNQHGVPGWFVYLPDLDLHTVSLPFTERFSGRSLTELGLSRESLFGATPLWASLKRDAVLFLNQRIAGSVYSRYVAGGNPTVPYGGLPEAVDAVCERVETLESPGFTYLYYPSVDSASHSHGPGSKQVAEAVRSLDAELARMAARVRGRARIVVSADHGSYDVRPEQKFPFSPEDRLSQMLLTPPSGEPLTATFHVQPGRQEEFASHFRAELGDAFALLTVPEAEDLRLLGPQPLSGATRERLGDFVALSARGESIVYAPESAIAGMKGFHGGLSPAEVRIPLVVA